MKHILFIFLLLPMLAFADAPRGEKMLERLWKDMKAGKVEQIGRYTSKHFQAVCPFRVLNRCRMLKFLKHIKIWHYKLSNVKTTECEKLITVTYQVTLRASLKCRMGKPPSPIGEELTWRRLDVWKKFDDKWKWAADALINLTPEPLRALT